MNETEREDEGTCEFEYTKVDKRASAADDADESVPEDAADESADEEPVAEASVAEEAAEEEMSDDAAEAAEDASVEDAAETEEAPEPSADPEADAAQGMMADPYQLLRLMVGMLSEAAWVNLGLHVTAGAVEPEVKLTEAKLAIDTLAFIRDQLQPSMDDEEKREMDNLVSTLQMNYVRRA